MSTPVTTYKDGEKYYNLDHTELIPQPSETDIIDKTKYNLVPKPEKKEESYGGRRRRSSKKAKKAKKAKKSKKSRKAKKSRKH